MAGTVDAAGREQLLRADDTELGPELGADQILATLPPGEREVRDLRAHPPREQGDQVGVLVVGVGADHQDALRGAELLQGGRQRRDAAGAGGGVLSRNRADGANQESEASPERAPHYGER